MNLKCYSQKLKLWKTPSEIYHDLCDFIEKYGYPLNNLFYLLILSKLFEKKDKLIMDKLYFKPSINLIDDKFTSGISHCS